ncbi:MAG: type II toxin-antitoxin system PemK/MazF family toxin [Terriglobales bacterium]
MARGLARGDVRLYTYPAPDKRRPVLVLTSDYAIGFLALATVAPVTSSIRGVRSEVRLDEVDGMKAPCAVNLHNVTTVRQDRLGPCLTRLSRERMHEVCIALGFALGCG